MTAALVGNLITNKKPVIDVFYGGKVSLDFTYFDENLILSDYAPVLRKNIKDFQNNSKRNVAPNEEIKEKKLLLTCYSKTDNTATRLFESILYYTKVIGFDVDTIIGDGNNNDKFIQDIKNKANEKHYDAIALNPLYIDTLNDYLNVLSKETPIVVFNRVPSNFLSLNQDNVYGVNVSFDIAKNAGNIVKKWYYYSLGLD